MHTSSNASGCGGSKLYVQYWSNVQHCGTCLSGSGWAASAEHTEGMQGYTLKGQFVDGQKQSTFCYLSLHGVPVT